MSTLSPLRDSSQWGRGFVIKLAALAALDAVAIFAVFVLIGAEAWGLLASLVVGTLFINWVYLWKGTNALRWITPGLVVMFMFVIWPIGFSFWISLTNWQTGNLLTKTQAIERLESEVTATDPDEAEEYDLFVYRDGSGDLRFWIRTDAGEVFFGQPRQRGAEPSVDPLQDPAELGIVDDDGDGVPESIGGFQLLLLRDLFGIANELETLILDLPDTGEVQVLTTSRARLLRSSQRYVYDAETDTLLDTQLGVTCVPDTGNFYCDGQRIDPGWRVPIGFDNYSDIITNERIRSPFLRVFTWNVVFAALSVGLTLAVGLALATALDDEKLRGRALYRSILILPYAVPAFISALVWRGMLNDTFGQVNRALSPLFDVLGTDPIPWLLDGFWAKVAILLVNTWLGFPYMFLIVTGALQSIPSELKEAARVDGAGPIRVFRTVTFPLLMVSIAPLLIGSFAFNFNNFVLIFLLTNGGPPILDSAVPVGETDILISFTFDIAVQSGRGQNFALGAALAILIFILVALISAASFRLTKRLEDVYG